MCTLSVLRIDGHVVLDSFTFDPSDRLLVLVDAVKVAVGPDSGEFSLISPSGALLDERATVEACALRDGDAITMMMETPPRDRRAAAWVKRIDAEPHLLRIAPEFARADPEVVMTAVRHDGHFLSHATSEIRATRKVVVAAVSTDGLALEFASEELRADRAVVLEALSNNAIALRYASTALRADRDVVLAAVSRNGFALAYASEALCADADIVFSALQQTAISSYRSRTASPMTHASDELRDDHKFMLAAVKLEGRLLQFASEDLRNNLEIVMAAVGQTKLAFQYASAELQMDRGVRIAAGEASLRERIEDTTEAYTIG
eukprot:TRINITY_DN38530_c0_g1_i1.p1 TRINITY_DN38530_c0_g1~~TRINITY_DN38530_c0_g1_i1.p1  ORF type:complete len:319 (-),score=47.38 TRINITY_DN38530_c0_g1_i1:51-1007(-)